MADSDRVESDQDQQQNCCVAERAPRDCFRIKQRNHDYRSHVIDNRQRGQKYFCSDRCARRNQRQRAQGKGDIGRHRDAPAARPDSGCIEHPINRRRYDHSPDRAGDRQRGLSHRCQFAHKQLALNFKTDQQEKRRH